MTKRLIKPILGGPDKYAGSHEQMAMAIKTHCTFAPLELQRLFEITLFSFAIGNGDAHRKNFSLLTREDGTIALSPAYDLVSSRLVIAQEAVELALTLNNKRDNLQRDDFLAFAAYLGITPAYARRKLADLTGLLETFTRMIAESHLSPELCNRLAVIIIERLDRLR